MGYLLGKGVNGVEPDKGKNCVIVNKVERRWTSDTQLQSLEFAQLVFGLTLVQCFLTMMFWNGNVYPLMLETFNQIHDFLEIYSL